MTCEEDVKRTKYTYKQDLDESLSVDKKADCKAKSKDGFKNEKHARQGHQDMHNTYGSMI